jgi:hypothetical protein
MPFSIESVKIQFYNFGLFLKYVFMDVVVDVKNKMKK